MTLAIGSSARAQTPACDALEGAEKAAALSLLKRLHPYTCCNDSISACLAAKSPCKAAMRMANGICRLARYGWEEAAIEKAFADRKKSMDPGTSSAGIALEEAAGIGEAGAPVKLVVYACSRCPFCRDMVLGLHREVTEGALKGKGRLFLKPFPLKDHQGATEGDLAIVAAGRMGKLWPFTLYLYNHFDLFHPAVLADWAELTGMDRARFEKLMADPQTREVLAESKKEGLRNKVAATPTIFIDGRLYSYVLDLDEVVDLALEEHERLSER
jgi:protein-disulfide isomerase